MPTAERDTTKPAEAPRRSRKHLRRVAYAVAVFTGLLILGLVAQSSLEGHDASRFPAPGELVDVGDGRNLHMLVSGQEHPGPTIVLEVGGAMTSSAWAWIQPHLAEQATVVSYDRANTGWSDAASKPAGSEAVIEDLRTGLRELGLQGPYLLVGHSIGGHYMQEYAALHPAEVAGLVLLDPSPPGWARVLPEEMASSNLSQQGQTGMLRAATAVGITRLYNPLAPMVEGLPEPERSAMLAASLNSRHLQGMERDSQVFVAVGEETERFADLGDLPVRIVSAGISDDPAYSAWQDAQWSMHEHLLQMSGDAEHTIIEQAAHTTLLTDRVHARAVGDIVISLLDEVQAR